MANQLLFLATPSAQIIELLPWTQFNAETVLTELLTTCTWLYELGPISCVKSKMSCMKYRHVNFLLKIYLHFHFHERLEILFESWLERFGILRKKMRIWDLAKWFRYFSGKIWNLSVRFDLRFAHHWYTQEDIQTPSSQYFAPLKPRCARYNRLSNRLNNRLHRVNKHSTGCWLYRVNGF